MDFPEYKEMLKVYEHFYCNTDKEVIHLRFNKLIIKGKTNVFCCTWKGKISVIKINYIK